MAFDREAPDAPVRIGSLEVTLYLHDPLDIDGIDSVHYAVQVHFSGGTKVRAGNLIPHLTTQERTQLQAFMATLRARAVAEILPGGVEAQLDVQTESIESE